jgi:predicted outer membrane repeat protein
VSGLTEENRKVEMKLNGICLIVYLIALIALIPSAYGDIQITTSGGSNGGSGSVSMNFDTMKTTAVDSQIAINGATVTPSTAITGPIATFEQTHSVKDASGKSASVHVKVLNALNGLTYRSKVLPKEGSVTTRTQVSAEQWLTVPKADSIKCAATASYGTTRFASVGLEESNNSLIEGDYVTLTGYYGKAVTTGTSVIASQTVTSGAANSILINGTAKDSSGTYRVDTRLQNISGGKATFAGLGETSSAGITTQVVQTEHVHGTFTSTANYTSATGIPKTKTRDSGYGTEYDLTMVAKKYASGPDVSGMLGFYVNPALGIQGAVNAAQSGDIINAAAGIYSEDVNLSKDLTLKGTGNPTASSFTLNAKLGTGSGGITAPLVYVKPTARIQDGVTLASFGGVIDIAAGTYKENVKIDKSLIVNGAGAAQTIVDGNKTGSVFTVGKNNPNIDVTLANMAITGGSGSLIKTKYGTTGICGGGVLNLGKKMTITDSIIQGNTAQFLGGGIYNVGTLNVLGSTISGNTAGYGGGFYNYGTTTVQACTITKNAAISGGGGIYSCCSSKTTLIDSTVSYNSAKKIGGGIATQGTIYIKGASTISGNTAKSGGAINWLNRRPIMDATTVITGNSNPQIYPR